MGLTVEIYKCDRSGDCTNGGLSGYPYFEGITLTNVEGPFEPNDRYPAATLEVGPFNSVYIKFDRDKERHTMHGGNFAASCDSRFNSAIKKLIGHHFYGAVAIHDRKEDY